MIRLPYRLTIRTSNGDIPLQQLNRRIDHVITSFFADSFSHTEFADLSRSEAELAFNFLRRESYTKDEILVVSITPIFGTSLLNSRFILYFEYFVYSTGCSELMITLVVLEIKIKTLTFKTVDFRIFYHTKKLKCIQLKNIYLV